MPNWEILFALVVAALAADSSTVTDRLARLALTARGRWEKHKRE